MLSQQHLPNKPALIIGNGTSRKRVDLEQTRSTYTSFGCNALYRDWPPNYLIAVDARMIREIIASGYWKTNTFWPARIPYDCELLPLLPWNLGWASGPTAANAAIEVGHKELFFLGFDLASSDNKINNLYADSENYLPSASEPTPYGNWVDQIGILLAKYPEVSFTRIVEINSYSPKQWQQHINYTEILLEDWINSLKSSKI